MRRHSCVDILEHIPHRGLAPGVQSAVAFRLLLRAYHGIENFRLRLRVPFL
jgi:hypothetical protein